MRGGNTMKSLKKIVSDCERRHILLVLRACKNDKVKAAEVLEIGTSTLYRKINELKLKGDLK